MKEKIGGNKGLEGKFEPKYKVISMSDDPKKYSPVDMSSYDKERHVPLNDVYTVIKSQRDSNLSTERIDSAIKNNEIAVYEFNGQKYLDRLDIGRVYHNPSEKKEGLVIGRYFTKQDVDPFDSVEFDKRDLMIKSTEGKVIFKMDGVEVPKWMDNVSAQIVAQKYFFNPDKKEWKAKLKNKLGTDHESSLKHLNRRVTDFFVEEGGRLGYFKTEEDKEAFRDELNFLQINGMTAFNSPVQFNAGLFNSYGVTGSPGINYHKDPKTGEVKEILNGEYVHPQCHACFIKGPNDNLESLAQNVIDEIGIFSSGSGIGHNCDNIRGNGEKLSGGGRASGPLSFEMIYDRVAGSIKSGGKTRRAARWLGMGYQHRDIMNFIRMKVNEDKKAKTLMEAGFSPGMDGDAYATVAFQNTNLSVRLTDGFFDALKNNEEVELHNVNTGEVSGKISADRMLKEIAYGSWRIGDPAVQYESKMNEMHTCKNSGRQRATNPCGEYSFIDNTSCNLLSHRLTAFLKKDGKFDTVAFKHAVKIGAIAQDIANNAASYPVKEIALISPEFNAIGMGFADLGALLMRQGIAYNSEKGRAITGAISALMTGTAYETSIELAKSLGTFTNYEFNKKHMLNVVKKHRKNLDDVLWGEIGDDNLFKSAQDAWKNVVNKGQKYGFRNAQVSVLAPTGTISFLMGCSTTGIEPAYSLSTKKTLAGGGNVVIENKDVEGGLKSLGYNENSIKDILDFIDKHNTVINAPHLSPEHYQVFDTADADGNVRGAGTINLEGHLGMVAAAQPFISGAISKTINLPQDATVKDFYDGYLLGYKGGLKGTTFFRKNSKPISVLGDNEIKKKLGRGEKEELPTRRKAYEWEVQIGGTPFHIITSEYPDGRPGQITFLSYKAGSTLGAIITTAGISASKVLKRGVNLDDAIDSWGGQQFEPNGLVLGHPFIKTASSPLDFAYKVLRLEYLGDREMAEPALKAKIKQNDLRGFQNGAFRTYERMKVDEWDIESVLRDPETGGFAVKQDNSSDIIEMAKELGQVLGGDFVVGVIPGDSNGNGHGNGDSENGNGNKQKNSSGKVCASCGNVMRPTGPNCYECKTCGDKIGGCGA